MLVGCGPRGSIDPGGPPPDAQVPARTGRVFVQSYASSSGAGSTASAGFFPTGLHCTVHHGDPCDVTTCSTDVTPTQVSAGTLAITGIATPIRLEAGSDGTYASSSNQTELFSGGEVIAVDADGATVPAFSGTFVAPAKAKLTSPAKPSGMLTIDRSAGLDLTWTGGISGKLLVSLDGSPDGTPRVECRFPVAARAGTVPASALASLSGTGGFSVGVINGSEVEIGEYAIDLEGYFDATWASDDTIVGGGVTYE